VRTAAGSWARPLVRILGLPARPGRSQRVVGALVVVAATALLALGALRPRLFGADYAVFGDQGVQRTYDEQSLTRLSWFLSWPAFLLALVGLAVVALRRWNAALWTVVLPPLLLLPVYAWHTRNSTRLMWWARRYVPVVLPGLLALVAVAVGVALVALLAHRWSARLAVGLPALAVTAGLLAFALPQSLPLRHHAEMAGSFEVTAELAALSGAADGVYLWPRQPCCLTETGLFPGALWLGRGQLSALLPADQAAWGGYIRSFEHGFPDSPLFVIGSGTARPEIPGLATVAARHIVTALPYWQESDTTRPDHEVSIPVDFTVWRVQGT
jgi:hypothetical protein